MQNDTSERQGKQLPEAALQIQSERIELALNSGAIVGTWVWNIPDDRFTADERFAKSFSLDPHKCREGLPLTVVAESIHPDDLPGVEKAIAAVLERGGAYSAEYRVRHSDGSYRWVEANGRCELGPDGRPLRFPGVLIDIDRRKHAEAELRGRENQLQRSYETFSSLIQNNPFGVYLVDADFRLQQISLGAQKVFGNVRPSLGRDFAEVLRAIWKEPFATEAISHFRHTLTTGEAYIARDTTQQRADVPEVESYDWRIERVTLPDGRFGVVCYFYDMTERHHLESQLKESAHRFRRLAESMPQIVWEATADGTITYYNERFAAETGVPVDAGTSGEWPDVVHPDDRAATVHAWQTAVQTGEPYDIEHRLVGADGHYRWFLSRGVPVKAADGRVLQWFGTATNVDAQKRAEAAVRDRERQLRTILDLLPVAVFISDREGRIVEANRAADQIWGAVRPLVASSSDYDTYKGWFSATGQRLQAADWAAARVLATGEPVLDQEVDIETFSGARKTILNSSVPLRDEAGGLVGAVTINVDISERKRATETLIRAEKLASVGRMAATMAHEINNPLEIITNLVYLLSSDPGLSPRSRSYLETAEAELQRVAHITKQTLAFYRETGKFDAVELGGIAAKLAAVYQPRAQAKGITVTADVRQPCRVWGSAGELAQVISNLLLNSLEAAPSGGAVALRIAPAEMNGGRAVRVTVADNGAGIAPHDLARIFEAFYTTKKDHGTGLGLYVTRELVEKHGGSIRVRSQLGKGTVFSILLPANQRNARTQVTAEPACA